MLLGLDVGGTFTDAVIIDGHRVVSTAKRRTTKDNLMQGIGEALDAVLDNCDTSNIEQVTLSTTVVTNTIVEKKEQVVDLYVVTGPGRNVDDIFPVSPIYLQGYTDHRGIVVEPYIYRWRTWYSSYGTRTKWYRFGGCICKIWCPQSSRGIIYNRNITRKRIIPYLMAVY